jgi:hypothetical protein
VAVSGDYACVAAASAGLRVISVVDPAHPTEVGYHDSLGSALGVAVSGSYAYVAYDLYGLRVISIPGAAQVGYNDTLGEVRGVAVSGSYAYVANGDSGLRVISVSDPAHPAEVGHCDTPGEAQGVAVSGDYAYVADGSGGLRVISVSNPAHPVEVGYYDALGIAHGVTVSGDYVYVADGSAGLQILQFYGVGVEESPQPQAPSRKLAATVVRGVLFLGERTSASSSTSYLLDAAGRRVMGLKAGANDVRALAPGVYFIRDAQVQAQAQAVRRVVITK